MTVTGLDKDGTIIVKDDAGNLVRYAKESDLLVVKGSKETAERKLQEAEDAHKVALEGVQTQLSEATNKLTQAEAAKEQLEEKLTQSTGSIDELASTKQKLEDANKDVETLNTKVLESRRKLVATTFSISPETVATKTTEQLDAFEDALKAVQAGKGVGGYAIAPGGGVTPATLSPIEQAKEELKIAREMQAKGISTSI